MVKLTKIFAKTNAFIFHITNGRFGNQVGKQSVLLLQTIGRKSGKFYYSPLSYYRDGNNYLVVASNWGREYQPDWFLNLCQNPNTVIIVNNKTLKIEARKAEGQEYKRLWGFVTNKNAQYLKYQMSMKRQIPILILSPLTEQVS
jgi:F420H(2)-dependent quinone reductase